MSNQLFFLGLADIFSVYPTIFREIASKRDKPSQIYLPSDADWQEKLYLRLLEVQKAVNEALERGSTFEEVTRRREKPIFDTLHVLRISPIQSPNGLRYIKKCRLTTTKCPKPKTFWSLENVVQAAKLLRKPPITVDFNNEHEMRKVYSLIYDVFRYKIVLSNALNDVGFYKQFPQHADDQCRVWLMLFELYHRQFKNRKIEHLQLQIQLYREAQVQGVAQSVWECRTRLAASLSRMRIKFCALHLSQLLPIHLRNEKVAIAASNRIVTGWINPFYLRDKNTAEKLLAQNGFVNVSTDEELSIICKNYKWDNISPLFVTCIPGDRNEFTKSSLLTQHNFILQDKTFSYGPAVMSKLLDFFELDGDILQTHISSPRSTAYLASLLYSVNRVNNFYVYGAGSNLKEYRKYMEDLGISNIRIFAESFTSFPLESKRFGTVVGIFANPPNSFSAISDPIDLICSRGGDLSMLEVLTETEISDEGKHRVSLILEEQLVTLQMALSRPHIQFVLYQTHSIVTTENDDMVKYCVELLNATSLEKHKCAFREKKRLEALAELEAANIPAAATAGSPRKRQNTQTDDKMRSSGKGSAVIMRSDSSIAKNVDVENTGERRNQKDTEDDVTLPECDEFIVVPVPDICINRDNCMEKRSTGCYLSLIKRKDITHCNAKYLIKMAENRGLFGKGNKSSSATSKMLKQETKIEQPTIDNEMMLTRRFNKTSNIDCLIKRLMNPTNASFIRSNLCKISNEKYPILFNFNRRECLRYKFTITISKLPNSFQRAKSRWQYYAKCLQRGRIATSKKCHRNTDITKSKYKYNQRIKLTCKIILI